MKAEDQVINEFQTLERIAAQAREEKEEALKQKEEERKQKEEERKQKEEAQRREKEAIETITKMIKQLHAKGVSVSEIFAMTGKTEEEIKRILE